MKSIIQTRFMRWRLEWKSLIVWLLLPMILTIFLLKIINVWVDETKVPIGLVIEDETNLVTQLVYDISNTQLLDIHFLQRPEALQKLEAHELDSVFIIRKDYEKNILVNQRNQLIEAYASNRSFAYSIVTEIISSFAQQDASRSKAAFEVKHLYKKYDLDEQWQWEEIVAKSRERQQSESLLTTELSFQNSDGYIQEDPTPLLQTWGVWSLLTLLTTFLLYDWVLKEHTSAIKPRWLFTKISFTQYATLHFVIYTILLLAMDLTTVVVFHFFYQEHITISFIFSLLIFRLTINLFAFLLANQFKQVLFYYVSSIALTLLLGLFGGAIIPLDGLRNTLSWMTLSNPIYHFLNESVPFMWLSILIGVFGLWMWKGDRKNAYYTKY